MNGFTDTDWSKQLTTRLPVAKAGF